MRDLITVTRTGMAEIGNDFVQSAKLYVDAYEVRGLELAGLLITGAFFATTSLEIVHAFFDAAKKLREQLTEAVQAILDDFDTDTEPLRPTRPATPVASIGSTFAPDLFRPSFLPEEIYVAAENLAEAQAQTPVAPDSDSEVVKALAGCAVSSVRRCVGDPGRAVRIGLSIADVAAARGPPTDSRPNAVLSRSR